MKIEKEKTEGIRYRAKCVCGREIVGKDEKTFFSNLKTHELRSIEHLEYIRKSKTIKSYKDSSDEEGDVAPIIQ